MRRLIGMVLLKWAVRLLPGDCYEHLAIQSSLAEFREYDRYCAYAELLGDLSLSFARWRREWVSGTRMKGKKFDPGPFDIERGRQRQKPMSAVDLFGGAA